MKTLFTGMFLLLLAASGITVHANEADEGAGLYSLVYEGKELRELDWLPDSSGLSFSDVRDRLLYVPETNRIVPYDSSLPANVFQFLFDNSPYALHYGDSNRSDSTTLFMSPNGRFVAYIVDFNANYADEQMGYFPGLAVMDLSNGAVEAVEDAYFPEGGDYTPSTSQLRWSSDSTAFTIEPRGFFLLSAYHVQILNNDVKTLKTSFLYERRYHDESESYLGNPRDYQFWEIYGIDPTGRFVLGFGSSRLEKRGGMFVLDMETLAVDLLPQDAQSIRFKETQTPQLFYTTDAGLFEYDLSTHTTRLINPDYNFYINISPDGRYGALVSENKLYVLPLNP